ncbi:MAG TPA: MaoC family dehydratase N-terminal domain-containing protein [Actinomycetota bacterium]
MNPQLQGKTYPETAFLVEPERVATFRKLFGQRNGVPPTFLAAAEFAVMPMVIDDPELGLDFPRVLHGAQEYELERPVVEGETLRVRARLESIRVREPTSFLVIAMEVVDEAGEVVAMTRSTMVERSAT